MDENDIAKWSAVEEGAELLQIGETEQALGELTRVAAEEPENEYAHFFLGQVYFDKEDYARALKCYVRALEIRPRYVAAIIGAGHSLRMMGDHERAMRMGQEALRIVPDDPDTLYLLGIIHFHRGEEPQARLMLERFLETRPEIEVALEVEGMLQVLRGDVVEREDDD